MDLLNFTNLATLASETSNPVDLTYNGKMPEHHVVVEFVWHPQGNEILEQRCIQLTPDDMTADCILGELDTHLEPVFDELPKKGVWRVVVIGKMWSCAYDTQDGREYDQGVDWDILSANKFPCFGAIKEWLKRWKKTQ